MLVHTPADSFYSRVTLQQQSFCAVGQAWAPMIGMCAVKVHMLQKINCKIYQVPSCEATTQKKLEPSVDPEPGELSAR